MLSRFVRVQEFPSVDDMVQNEIERSFNKKINNVRRAL